ncbi:MAG: MFS transporter [Candidatus Eisenbacteria bacterium]|nr:MFS transporter [Candidatus Eisenbacteria bacterium]
MNNLVTLFLIVVGVAIFTRLSGNPLNHDRAYLRRRILNWVPLGIGYAFLYFGRYNLTVAKIALGDLMTKHEFGTIFAVGTWTYALAFLLNGPLTDKIGGRKAMLISTIGAAASNILIGVLVFRLGPSGASSFFRTPSGHTWLLGLFILLYALNMYFQSFGAVSIVKVNSSWFGVKERGVFGGIFGILISAGVFFAYDFGQWIVDGIHTARDFAGNAVVSPPFGVFWIPGGLLLAAAVWIYLVVRDRPAEAGFANFDTGDASSGEDDTPDPVRVILKKVVTNPVVLTIGAIEFCTGILRQGIMQWYPIYGHEMGYKATFLVTRQWGTMLFLAGATGGMTAGWISDKVFGSRRGPVAALLYSLMLVAALVMTFTVQVPVAGVAVDALRKVLLGAAVVLVSYCVIGTHGMLSGTATMDFGGRKNAGTAVGLIDGLVYLGTGFQAISLGYLTEKSWAFWPPFLIPFAVIGTILALRIWKAMPQAAHRKA